MRELVVEPDVFTFVNLLCACSQTCDFDSGRYVNWHIENTRVKTDIYVQNALVDMYFKCGYIALMIENGFLATTLAMAFLYVFFAWKMLKNLVAINDSKHLGTLCNVFDELLEE
ncbi:hypothetical protein L1049_022340 [Liquidambar formosana]|uniref:Uncharacterized protein n=1 Tax=Liquidambar formosana TaxID=63359 RepID=A0AAP0WQ33_LIQFO